MYYNRARALMAATVACRGEGEVTDVNVARRLINYTDLIEEFVARLVTDGVAETKGLRQGCSYTAVGRYLRLHATFDAWLGVDLHAWCEWGITPIWSEHKTRLSSSGIPGEIRQAAKLFDDAKEDNGWLYLPILLTTGAEWDRVVEDATRQMHSIADKLREAFPAA